MGVKMLGVAAVVLVSGISSQGRASADATLSQPEGPVILKISGAITRTNAGDEAHFDRTMLKALPQHSVYTGTPWTDQVYHYRGPLMRTLLAHVGTQGDQVHVAALNGYEATIPIRDFDDHAVLLAMERDGEAMAIREYGPLWVLYPFDHDEALLSEKIRFRAVWQVMRMHVH